MGRKDGAKKSSVFTIFLENKKKYGPYLDVVLIESKRLDVLVS